ncbi:hypothetical protein, conserved [Babesia bigemina]|uniref:Uncharacterized protein n=1 Tax=Babesia bigemina TaxID=5866 RepID=A0A061DCA5_BABBI|nr:hypothetical protein, conserved [Babesia bigemina]CDR97687.1 hypothetical protein, conserved [Babesia bigemina]|eukprot:XP_012769873.1 hypothetical protein, conserved [Babesia bigemina]
MTGGAKDSLVRENDRQWTLSNRVEAEGLEWLYADPSAAKQKEGNLEEYLLGKSIEGARGELARDPIDHAAAGSLLADTAEGQPLDDTLNKFREDPLFIIKKIELHQRQVMKKYESLVKTGVKPTTEPATDTYATERPRERHDRRRVYDIDRSGGRDYSTSPRRRDRSRGRMHRASRSHRRERGIQRSESLRRRPRGSSRSRDYETSRRKRDRSRSPSGDYRHRRRDNRHRSGRRSSSIGDSERSKERCRTRASRHSYDSRSSGSRVLSRSSSSRHSGRYRRGAERRRYDSRHRQLSRSRVRRHSRNTGMDSARQSRSYDRHRRRSRSPSDDTYRRKQRIADERRPRDGRTDYSPARRSPSYGRRHHTSSRRNHSSAYSRSSKSADSDRRGHRRERRDYTERRRTRLGQSDSAGSASYHEERDRRRERDADRDRRGRSRSRGRGNDYGGRKEEGLQSSKDERQETQSKEPMKAKCGPVLPRKGDTLRYAFGVTEDIMPPQAIQDRAEQRRREMEERKRLQRDTYAPQNHEERLTEMQSHGMSHLKERMEKMAEHERNVQSEEVDAKGAKGDYISLMKQHAFESAKKEERIRQRASRSLVEDE